MTGILRWPAALAAAGILALAAGCGSGYGTSTPASPAAPAGGTASVSSPPAPQALADQVQAALRHATSTHITADVTRAGKHVRMAASLTRSGGVDGRITVNQVPITVLVTKGSAYIKVTQAFLKYAHLPSAGCSLICGKFLKTSGGDIRTLTSNLNWSSLVNPESQGKPQATFAGTATVAGQPAWKLRGSHGTIAYVAARGTPYPLRLTRGGNQIDFTQWNHATISPPPPASQVVDTSKLGGG